MAGYSHDSHLADILSNGRAWFAEESFFEKKREALRKKAAVVAKPTRRSHPERTDATGGRHAPVMDPTSECHCRWILRCLKVPPLTRPRLTRPRPVLA